MCNWIYVIYNIEFDNAKWNQNEVIYTYSYVYIYISVDLKLGIELPISSNLLSTLSARQFVVSLKKHSSS